MNGKTIEEMIKSTKALRSQLTKKYDKAQEAADMAATATAKRSTRARAHKAWVLSSSSHEALEHLYALRKLAKTLGKETT